MSGSILTVREEWMGIAVEYRRVTLPAAPMRKRRLLFFQAEDGIRDSGVTGVQTCALPILESVPAHSAPCQRYMSILFPAINLDLTLPLPLPITSPTNLVAS